MEIKSPEVLVVYQLYGKDPLLIPREEIVFTDRTRGIARDRCNRKAYIEYEAFDTGLQSTGWNEHIEIGSTVHKGLEQLMMGESIEVALDSAYEYYVNSRPPFEWLLPEIDELLYNDALYLAKGLIYAFDRRVLGHIQEKFDLLAAEEEINWLMGELDDGRYLVMMSRPDGVWREKATSKLWHISFKTTKSFNQEMLDKLEIDQQKWSEGYAIQAKYGQQVAGTLYYYLIKGTQSEDSDLNIQRWNSGLIRPFLNTQAHIGGVIAPENLWYEYKWFDLNERKKKQLNWREWKKIDIYREMPYGEYIDYLDREIVGPNAPHGRDFLQEAVAGPSSLDETDTMAVRWNEAHASRWLEGRAFDEGAWAEKIKFLGRTPPTIVDLHFDRELRALDSDQCFAYRSRCSMFDYCWRGKSLEQMIEDGKLKPRVANHSQESDE